MGGGVESGGQGRCERRIEVFVEMKKKSGEGGGGRVGVRLEMNEKVKLL